MKKKKRTKKSIYLCALLLLFPFALRAENGFQKIWDDDMWHKFPGSNVMRPDVFKQFGNLTHFPVSNAPYIVVDNANFKKTFTAFNTGVSQVEGNFLRPVFIRSMFSPQSVVIKIGEGNGAGLLFIENSSSNPNFTKFVPKEDLPGMSPTDLFTGFQPVFSMSDFKNYYFYTTRFGLHKLNNDMTEQLAYYPFPDNYFFWNMGFDRGQHIVMGLYDTIWVVTHQINSGLLEFDMINEQWTVYDETNLPIKWRNANSNQQQCNSLDYYTVANFLDFHTGNPKPIVAISAHCQEGSNYNTDNALLYFNRETDQFDTIRIDLTDTEYFGQNPNMYVFRNVYPIYELNKIVMTFRVPWQGIIPITSKYFLIYDWETKTLEVLAPDDAILNLHSGTPHIRHADYFQDSEGNDYIGLLWLDGDFIIYNPTTNVFEQVERRSVPDLWFKVLYPNPAKPSSRITTEIWCWLNEVSKVELGLYDFNGGKILDLSNQFEYDPATATIHISFDVPASLSRGTYFLVVRNGSETHSRGIIIGE